jgi:hypothetical protein
MASSGRAQGAGNTNGTMAAHTASQQYAKERNERFGRNDAPAYISNKHEAQGLAVLR